MLHSILSCQALLYIYMQRGNFPSLDWLGHRQKVSGSSPHRVGRSHFQGCLLGSVEATSNPVLSQFSPFEGSEGRGKNQKAGKRLRKSLADSQEGISTPLPQVLNPMSLQTRVLQILQTSSGNSTKLYKQSFFSLHRIEDFKPNSRVLQAQQIQL